ncbi:hypothetical protein ACE1OE_03990 [Vibrio sp. E150_011]
MSPLFISDLREKSLSKKAKLALILTGWVLFVCLMQNSGLLQVCSHPNAVEPNQSLSSSKGAISEVSSANRDASLISPAASAPVKQASDECSLSSKLLNFHTLDLDGLWLITLTVMLLTFGVCRVYYHSYRPFTEPIFSRYRIHLRLCTFHE